MTASVFTTTRQTPITVGVLSDTHGLLRPEVLPALEGVGHIIHAGDVGDAAILDSLRRIAPVTAVRGNVDVSGAVAALPFTDAIELAGQLIYVVHRLQDLDINPAAAQIRVAISGHTHKAVAEWKAGVLYLNPGSVGPRRFRLPITLAKVHLSVGLAKPEIIAIGETGVSLAQS